MVRGRQSEGEVVDAGGDAELTTEDQRHGWLEVTGELAGLGAETNWAGMPTRPAQGEGVL